MDTNDYATNVIQIMDSAFRLYFRLILMAGPAGSGKTSALQEVSARASASLVNVILELSRRMLDLTKRKRALLREFEEYRKSKEKRLKVFRLEAVRAGFKKGMAGAGLRDHHRRGAQDPRERPPGGPQAADVVRPGTHPTWGGGMRQCA